MSLRIYVPVRVHIIHQMYTCNTIFVCQIIIYPMSLEALLH